MGTRANTTLAWAATGLLVISAPFVAHAARVDRARARAPKRKRGDTEVPPRCCLVTPAGETRTSHAAPVRLTVYSSSLFAAAAAGAAAFLPPRFPPRLPPFLAAFFA